MSNSLKCVVLTCLSLAPSARGQWSGALWPATTVVARAHWTNAAGAAMTGSVKDARAYQMDKALDERYIAAGLTSGTNAYKPKWYLWERANVVRFKTAAINAMGHYSARWLADGTDFSTVCAASNWVAVPRMDATNTAAYLGLPTNFWTYTPWIALNTSSNGWDNIKRVVDLMTWTVSAAIVSTQETHAAINRWNDEYVTYQYLYGNDFLYGPSWPEATAHVDESWLLMVVSFDDSGANVWNCTTQTVASAGGPSCWSGGEWADDGITNWRAIAYSSAYWPAGAAVTNYERAADFYHTATRGVAAEYFINSETNGIFSAWPDGVETTAVMLAQVAAGSIVTVRAASAVGEIGFPKTQPPWCAEPTGQTNSTFLGYGTRTMEWVFRWDATTNGFRYVGD